jgi:quinol monooxygenase YgiN
MLEAEMDNHLRYEPYERTDNENSSVLNGTWVDTPLGNIKFCLVSTLKNEGAFYMDQAGA